MRRRDFIMLVGSAATAWPLCTHAQQSDRRRRIGYLTIRSPLSADEVFVQELQKLGWFEGRNLIIERRYAAGDSDLLKKFAGELVRLKVDVIVAVASVATQAAKNATASIPICFLNAGDPVGQGFVRSLAHPGANITGTSFDASPDITAKQLQLLIEAVPKASRVAVLWNPTSAFLHSYVEVAQTAAAALSLPIQSFEVQDGSMYRAAFETMRRDGINAVLVLSDGFATFHRSQIVELAATYRLPALYGHNQYVEAGGLMSYGPTFSDAYSRGADYVDRILKGANPSDLPVQQPTKFELIVSLKTAKALDLEVPVSLLTRADKVTE